MTDTTLNAPGKRRGWLRKLLWLAGFVIVLLVVAYFVATSSAFFKGFILPRVSKALNAEVTVSDASISPFSQVVLHNLKVQTIGAEPLLIAPEVRVRYRLMDILRGNIHVDEAVLTSPILVRVENADKTTNLDPITKAQPGNPPAQPAKSSKPVQIDLRKLALNDGTLRLIKMYKNGNRDLTEIAHLTVTLDDLQNGKLARAGLSADVQVENNPPAPGVGGKLAAKVSGNFEFLLTEELKPGSVKGSSRLDVSRAEGMFADLAALGSTLDCELTPTEIKQLGLRFQKSGARLGEVRVAGPFDLTKTEGRLSVAILGLDKQILNLAGAKAGIGFGTTTLDSTNEIQVAKAGSSITAVGQLNLSKFEAIRGNEATPPLDFQAQYDVTVDLAQSNSLVRGLTLAAAQRGNPVLHAELTSPMSIAWGNAANNLGDSAFNLAVTGLKLEDWKAFLGNLAPAGTVNAQLKLLSQQNGAELAFDLNSQVENLTAIVGSNRVTEVSVNLQTKGAATALKQFKLSQYALRLAHQGQPMLNVSGSGTYDRAATNADMQVEVQVPLAQVMTLLAQPDAKIDSGTIEFKGRVAQAGATQAIGGELVLKGLNGRYGKNEFRDFGASLELDLGMTPQQVQLRKFAGSLTESGKVGGRVDLAGTINPATKVAQLTAKLADFNQDGLRPFLEPMLTDQKLVSVTINGKASAQYDPQGASALKADLQIANLLVKDAKNTFPATPLEAKLQMDASMSKQVADIRLFQVALTPTSRAKNELQLSGRVDLSQTNATRGQVQLVADSLDLTRYYDLFVGDKKPASSTPGLGGAKGSVAPAATEKEPEAMKLPLQDFTAEANIHRLYLREIEIAGLQTTVKIDGGHVVLNPFKLTLNGAPADLTLDLDLGVPGYKYNLVCNAQRVPLAPWVDSFQPERKGQISGTLTAKAGISGAGVTGPSLQKNLSGQFDVNSTNLNLAVVSLQNPTLKALVNVVSLVPEMLRNSSGAATLALQALTGKTASSGGLADELQRAPIDAILARGTVGSGRVELQKAVVQSAAFEAAAQGTITLAAIPTNSALRIPVSVSLSRSLAQRMNLVPAGTPTNAIYARLPDFLTMQGTVGKPKPEVNALVLTGAALKGIGGSGSGAGGVLQQVGELLTGPAPGSTNTAGNTQTNQGTGRGAGLLQGLGGILKEATTPQNGQTNQPATNQSPVNDLINGLFGPKKK